MAEVGNDVPDDEAAEVVEPAKGSARKWILLSLVLLLLVGGGGAGALLLLAPAEESAAGEGEAMVTKQKPPIYYTLSPAFIVNFEGERRVRFLQIEMDVMTRSTDVTKALREHNPVVRNNIVLLLSAQKHAELVTLEGKEKLRSEVLAAVQQTLREHAGDAGDVGVEAVYFTSFVMQ